MDQGVCLAQVIQEFIPQAAPLMRPWYKACNVQELNRDRALAIRTATVVWLAFVRYAESLTGAVYLEIANSTLRVDCSESIPENEHRFEERCAYRLSQSNAPRGGNNVEGLLTGSFLSRNMKSVYV